LHFKAGVIEAIAMKPRILFVDDEAPMCEMLALYFQDRGYEVTTVTTGLEAMRSADRERFDLAILDIRIAGENGLELLSYFKKNFAELPVVMFTGLAADDELLDQAMARGASGFMRKSEPLHDLLEAVQAYLPKP
jgi:CheY-like chemotaxis protein